MEEFKIFSFEVQYGLIFVKSLIPNTFKFVFEKNSQKQMKKSHSRKILNANKRRYLKGNAVILPRKFFF